MTLESEALDRIEELVASRYPKGTDDPLGKALRHQLHRAGRLNTPRHEYVASVVVGFAQRQEGLDFINRVREGGLAPLGGEVLMTDGFAVDGMTKHVNSFVYDERGAASSFAFGRDLADFARSVEEWVSF